MDVRVDARVKVSTRMNRTISEMKLSVKFYSLLTSFRVDSSVNIRVDAGGEARVDISTPANRRTDRNA